MRYLTRLAVVAAAVLTITSTAVAHQGNPNMQSIVRSVTPSVTGLHLEVLNRDDRFQLVNKTGRTVVIFGYNGEQYARVLPGGDVQVNTRSPAYYLNDDRYGAVAIPKTASAAAAPAWKQIAGDGHFQWHDHRMHYMGKGTPPAVKDASKRQKVFDYRIPIRIGATTGAINGTLLWTPQKDGGPPVIAVVALIAIALAALGLVVRTRRRRGPQPDRGADW